MEGNSISLSLYFQQERSLLKAERNLLKALRSCGRSAESSYRSLIANVNAALNFFSNVHLNKTGPYLVLVCSFIFTYPCKVQGKKSLNIYISEDTYLFINF